MSAFVLIFFVGLPLVVGLGALSFVSWRSRDAPPPVRTSELLARGTPARAEIIKLRTLGTGLDIRPMVAFRVLVAVPGRSVAESFELEIVQSVPRRLLHDLHPGTEVEIRLAADSSAAAIHLGG